jgi:hypothetical protein
MNASRNAYTCVTELRVAARWGRRISAGKSKPACFKKIETMRHPAVYSNFCFLVSDFEFLLPPGGPEG